MKNVSSGVVKSRRVFLETLALFALSSTPLLAFWGPKKPFGKFKDSALGKVGLNFRKDGAVILSIDGQGGELKWQVVKAPKERPEKFKNVESFILVSNSEGKVVKTFYFSGDDLIDAVSGIRFVREES